MLSAALVNFANNAPPLPLQPPQCIVLDAGTRVQLVSLNAEQDLSACGGHDLLLPVIDAASFDTALGWLARAATALPCTVMLALVHGLSQAQLTALLGDRVHDFLSLPLRDAELPVRLARALGLGQARGGPDLRPLLQPQLRDLLGASAVFTRQVAKLPTFAGCDAGVLICGETGTGKEAFAQAIHYLSARASKPWVAVNCGAIPAELVENELFGHVRGAYTTAHGARSGLVREAEGGTLFLDDIDCLPLAAQAKLLRFLQEREYRAIGSNTVQRSDVRVIAASNCNLGELAARGEFRPDLYFRLNVLNLKLPALRARRDDIAVLAQHFVGQFARRYGRGVTALAPAALQRLLGHGWPGNVRELQHVIERAVLLCTGPTLRAGDIDLADGGPGADGTGGEDGAGSSAADDSFGAAKARVVDQFERSFIAQLLSANQGNVTQAARAAKKNRRAFFALMSKHGIASEPFRHLPHP